MTSAHAIDNAIGAHGLWKARLRAAIATGTLDGDVETLRRPDRCTFGLWMLSGDVTDADRASTYYATVDRLHARFHEAAAHVAELAIAGQRDEAKRLMERGGDFAERSTELVTAMLRWKQALGA